MKLLNVTIHNKDKSLFCQSYFREKNRVYHFSMLYIKNPRSQYFFLLFPRILFRSGYDSNNRILIYFFSDQAHNVTIHNKERSLRAGSQHEFTCEALGSRPAAVITWWFDEKEIEAEIDNVQIVSLISFAT